MLSKEGSFTGDTAFVEEIQRFWPHPPTDSFHSESNVPSRQFLEPPKASDRKTVTAIIARASKDQNRPPDSSLLNSVTNTPRGILHQQQ
jgi:hypothetical protein